MNFKIYNFLDKNICENFIKKLQNCNLWQDGKLTTGEHLKKRKSNSELVTGDLYQEITNAVLGTFYGSDVGRDIYSDTFFNFVTPPMINKYNIKEKYGWHFDETIMPNQDGHLTRMDYSFTVFLNDDYEGGKLEIENQSIRGHKGQIVIYDNKLRHRVTEITKGTRYACIGWLSSLLEDIEVRTRLAQNQKLLRSYTDSDNEAFIALQKTHMLLIKKFT